MTDTNSTRRNAVPFVSNNGVLLALLGLFVLTGCGSDPSTKSSPKPKGSEAKAGPGEITEAQAKEKLKIALDSWTFGDSREKFEKDHPDIYFGPNRSQNLYKLLRYEIQAGRKSGKMAYEFSVIQVFQTQAGTESKENIKYEVDATGGRWDITVPTK